jgi:chromate transporter
MTRAVVVASAALLLSALLPLAHDTLTGAVPIAIAIVGVTALLASNIEPLWVVVAASLAGLLQAL